MYARGLTLTETARRNQIWSPARLFGGSDKGMLLTMRPGLLFQDSSGTTAVTGPGQPVGMVRRMAGTVDAAQAVSSARPTIGRRPRPGRRNLLTRSETLSHGVWTKQSSTVLSEMQVRDIPTS
ncbi:hypothetical protein, partial [Gemmobacter serpentinus]|uniref:hypothetical protein n=1 Tax=Gemmobacter serpentinus TaxID=2652247 RepID=UPI001CF6257E